MVSSRGCSWVWPYLSFFLLPLHLRPRGRSIAQPFLFIPLCHFSRSCSPLSMPLAHIPIHRASVITSLRSLYASSSTPSHYTHSLPRFHPRLLNSLSPVSHSYIQIPLKQSSFSSASRLPRSSHSRYSTLSCSISSTTIPTMTEKLDVFEAAAAGNLESIKTLGRVHLEAKNDRGWTPVKYTLPLHQRSLLKKILVVTKWIKGVGKKHF